MTKTEIRQRRQAICQQRARNARTYARLLTAVALVALSSGLWSDPKLGPQLATGIEELKPRLAGFVSETQLKDFFENARAKAGGFDDSAATEEAALALTDAQPPVDQSAGQAVDRP